MRKRATPIFDGLVYINPTNIAGKSKNNEYLKQRNDNFHVENGTTYKEFDQIS